MEHHDTRPPEDDPDKTNPNIKVRIEREDNPLIGLLEADEAVRELDGRIERMNHEIEGKTLEYGGLKITQPKLSHAFELSGVDENGIPFVVPRHEIIFFLKDILPLK